MNDIRRTLPPLLLGAISTLALSALAQPTPERGMRDGGMPPSPPPAFAPAPMEGPCPLPPYLRGLDLGEEQRDRMFDILHAQAPKLRELDKTLHKSHQSLRTLARSSRYDAAQARVLAESGAKTMAEIALLHAQTDHELFALLTPEQRKLAEADRPPGPGH